MKKIMFLQFLFILLFYSAKVYSQPTVGQTAPSIAGLKLLDKEMPDLGNKFVFIHFWASWCGSEDISLKHLSVLAERYKNKVIFLAVSEQNEEQVRGFLQGKLLNNIFFGLDNDLILHKNFTIDKIPVFYLISPKNIILANGGYSSEISDHEMDSLIMKNDSTILPNTTIIIPSQDSVPLVAFVKIKNKHRTMPSLMEYMYSFDVNDELESVLADPKDIRRNDIN